MRLFLLPLALVLAPVVNAQEKADPVKAALASTMGQIGAKQPDAALRTIDAVIPGIERSIEEARAKGGVFCAVDMPEALMYAAMADKLNQSSTIMDGSTCQALFLRAYLLIDLKRFSEGIDALEKLTALAPRNGQYLAELAFAYRSTGDLDKARTNYERAIEAGESTTDKKRSARVRALGLRGLGWVLIEQGDWDGAERALRQSLKFEPGHAGAKSELNYIKENRPRK
ncbi:tetratricopeptide repeat protein [Sphingomonas sp. ST-64]|uniref:Tetratricopeptide repeat protein n=1 Tax=Sphingomonas plantiphila TaxID=3163295 RepID=A0ABW8YJW5_9SPHN